MKKHNIKSSIFAGTSGEHLSVRYVYQPRGIAKKSAQQQTNLALSPSIYINISYRMKKEDLDFLNERHCNPILQEMLFNLIKVTILNYPPISHLNAIYLPTQQGTSISFYYFHLLSS